MKKVNWLVVLLIIVLVGTTTAYAKDVSKSSNMDVRYENINVLTKNTGKAKLSDSDVNFEASLQKPGDYFEFTVDVKNYNNYDVLISAFEKSILTDEEKRYLDYKVVYSDNSQIELGQVLKSNETKTIKVRLEYKYDITADDLPKNDSNTNLFLNMSFSEK